MLHTRIHAWTWMYMRHPFEIVLKWRLIDWMQSAKICMDVYVLSIRSLKVFFEFCTTIDCGWMQSAKNMHGHVCATQPTPLVCRFPSHVLGWVSSRLFVCWSKYKLHHLRFPTHFTSIVSFCVVAHYYYHFYSCVRIPNPFFNNTNTHNTQTPLLVCPNPKSTHSSTRQTPTQTLVSTGGVFL